MSYYEDKSDGYMKPYQDKSGGFIPNNMINNNNMINIPTGLLESVTNNATSITMNDEPSSSCLDLRKIKDEVIKRIFTVIPYFPVNTFKVGSLENVFFLNIIY